MSIRKAPVQGASLQQSLFVSASSMLVRFNEQNSSTEAETTQTELELHQQFGRIGAGLIVERLPTAGWSRLFSIDVQRGERIENHSPGRLCLVRCAM